MSVPESKVPGVRGGALPGLNPSESALVKRLLAHPLEFPQEFRAWLKGILQADPPTLPLGSMSGYAALTASITAAADQTSVLDKSATLVDTATASTTETTLYAYTVPAGTLATDEGIHVRMLGRGNTRASVLTLRLYWGGSVVFTTTFNAVVSANAAEVDLSIANRGATNSQVIGGLWRYYQSSAVIDGVTAAVDTTAAAQVKLTAQWSTLTATNSYQKMYAITTRL